MTRAGALNALDPRAPLVLDLHELGRRPGRMQTIQRRVPAPAGLGIDLIGVPPGGEIALDLRCESVVEGVLVTGTASVGVHGECARCLDSLSAEVEADVQELYVYDPADAEEDGGRMEGDLLDLEPVLRDAVVLALPHSPLCREDCPGLCPRCGARLADDPGHRHESSDSRWAALAALAPPGSGGRTDHDAPVTDDHHAAPAARRDGSIEES